MAKLRLLPLLKAYSQIEQQKIDEDFACRFEGDHLSLGRAHVLALDLERAEPDEIKHLEIRCYSCNAFLDKLRDGVPHPSWWQLGLYLLGLLPASDQERYQDHLSLRHCSQCRERLETLDTASGSVIRVLLPRPLQLEAQVQEAGQVLPVRGESPDGQWEARLSERWGGLTLEVQTREGYWRGYLLAFALHGVDNSRTLGGFLPLVETGYYCHHCRCTARFSRRQVIDDLGGSCQGFTLWLVDVRTLTPREAESLREAMTSRNYAPGGAWREWCGQTLESVPELKNIIREVLKKGLET